MVVHMNMLIHKTFYLITKMYTRLPLETTEKNVNMNNLDSYHSGITVLNILMYRLYKDFSSITLVYKTHVINF